MPSIAIATVRINLKYFLQRFSMKINEKEARIGPIVNKVPSICNYCVVSMQVPYCTDWITAYDSRVVNYNCKSFKRLSTDESTGIWIHAQPKNTWSRNQKCLRQCDQVRQSFATFPKF